MFDVLSEPEIEAYSAEAADEEENDVAYMVEPEDAIAAVMRASPADSAGQNSNGHVIAEEANPAAVPVNADQCTGAVVVHADEL